MDDRPSRITAEVPDPRFCSTRGFGKVRKSSEGGNMSTHTDRRPIEVPGV